jgi:hypothetical protein
MNENITIQFPTVDLTKNTYRYNEAHFLLVPFCGLSTALSSRQELQYIYSIHNDKESKKSDLFFSLLILDSCRFIVFYFL